MIEIGSKSDFVSIRSEWLTFALRLDRSSYFQSPDWAIAWWETLAGEPETKIGIWRDELGALVAVAPISWVKERLHRRIPLALSYWTNTGSGVGSADHAGFLTASDKGGLVRHWLETLEGPLVLRNISSDARYIPEEATATAETVCPRLDIPPGEEPIGRSAKYRKRLRRNSRILRERGLEFTAVDGPDVTEDKGWGSTFTPERVAFHRNLLASSDKGRGPAMMLATRDSEIVGVLYGFWWANSFSYFQTGWDPQYWELSLGSALVYEMVLHARAEGATVFDFLRGPEEYKYRFGAEDRRDQDWLVARRMTGKVLATKARLRG